MVTESVALTGTTSDDRGSSSLLIDEAFEGESENRVEVTPTPSADLLRYDPVYLFIFSITNSFLYCSSWYISKFPSPKMSHSQMCPEDLFIGDFAKFEAFYFHLKGSPRLRPRWSVITCPFQDLY